MQFYFGLFTIAFSALSLEVLLARLLSVTSWYHLSFFVISTAMLGGTAGATRVYLRPRLFARDGLERVLTRCSIELALSIPVTLVMLCLVPLAAYASAMSICAVVTTTVACSLPFYFVGIITSAVLTKVDLPVGRLYGADLIGASLGCLFVLGGLELLDVPSLVLVCGGVAALGGWCFSSGAGLKRRLLPLCLLAAFIAGGILNSTSSKGIRPLVVKGSRIEPATQYLVERWNSFSRVAVYPLIQAAPRYWGASEFAPMMPVNQYWMNIDGEAATVAEQFTCNADIDHLRYDVTAMAYCLGRKGDACIIGVGGGRDVQTALLFGHRHVTGIEINPIFIDLLQNEFKTFAGIAGRPEVTLVKAEARGYLSRHPAKYAVIEMSLTDTWASTGAGAYSLSENALYTEEAWAVFLDRLSDDGIFSVSRWHSSTKPSETARLVALAAAALLRRGVQEPSKQIALITGGNVATLLLSPRPFSPDDLRRIRQTCRLYWFRPLLLPGVPPELPLLRQIAAAPTYDELWATTNAAETNCTPTTDENPYFFNMLRLSHLGEALAAGGGGVLAGNLTATLTLAGLVLTLLVLAIATIVVPLLLRERSWHGFPAGERARPGRPRHVGWGAVYFSLIGAAFMLTEIALIERLTVLLSHPIYALGILLFTIIASSGLGSLLSDRLPLTSPPWIYLYPLAAAASIVGIRFLLTALLAGMVTAGLEAKIAAAVAVVFPLGLIMGMFFPTGMRLAKSLCPMDTPWYWALNGIFGVPLLCGGRVYFDLRKRFPESLSRRRTLPCRSAAAGQAATGKCGQLPYRL